MLTCSVCGKPTNESFCCSDCEEESDWEDPEIEVLEDGDGEFDDEDYQADVAFRRATKTYDYPASQD